MIVAARALERLGEEGFADTVGDIVEEALARDLGDFHAGEFPRAHAEKTGGNDRLGIFRLEFITGDLLAHKVVVRFVVIKRADDVVAVTPRVAALKVVGETAAVGVAHDVEPVLRHALAVVRAGEESGEEVADGRLRIGDYRALESGNFLGRRGETEEVEGRAANEGACVGGGRGGEAGGEFCGEEGVDWVCGRGREGGAGRGGGGETGRGGGGGGFFLPVSLSRLLSFLRQRRARHRRLRHRLIGPHAFGFVAAVRPVGREAPARRHDHAVFGGPFFGVSGGDLFLFRSVGPRGAGGDPLF